MKVRLFLVLIIFSLFSCGKEPAIVTVLDNEILVGNINGSTTFTIECTGNWTASAASLWCTVSPLSGHGNGTITVTVLDNKEDTPRKTTIYVSAGDTRESIVIKQGFMSVETDKRYISFDESGGSQILKITSNTDWTLNIPDSWITADKTNGSGVADISFTVPANQGTRRISNIEILYDSGKKTIIPISQKIAGEPFISRPTPTSPANAATGENRIPVFKWDLSEFSLTGEVKYYVEISEDISGNGNWLHSSEATIYNIAYFDIPRDPNKTYYWRVVAEDINGDVNVSNTFSFTTGAVTAYLDGEPSEVLSSVKASPVEIIFVGDGYTPDDFVKGGKFDADVNEGVKALFSVEPFKSYKEYFKIHKVAAYSIERGATVRSDEKNTKFRTTFVGGDETSAATDTVTVRDYAINVPGMNKRKLDSVLIVVLSNIDMYAGSAYIDTCGSSIAIVPISRDTEPGMDYASIILHEAGGHGFGRLADEYKKYNNSVPDYYKERINNYSKLGYFANIDLTGEMRNVKWRHFRNLEGYDRVGAYEGAYHYAIGIWRPEVSSCMIDNIPYFNAPSREAIVKRILKTAREEYEIENFIEKDIEKKPSAQASAQVLSRGGSKFIPLGKPILQ